MTTTDVPPSTGELLDGRYRLLERIGSGGMGVVYRAHDDVLERTVAIKLFKDSTADELRTSSEKRLLAGLNHASLVTLFDAKTDVGQAAYLVMEFVDGPTLRDRLKQGPIAPLDVAHMAADLAEGLHVVHTAGIVHRDIKPSNILLRPSHVEGEEFRAKLADFGIAYLLDSTRLTLPGTLIGTAAYLSPEQVRGAAPASPADVYALGLVLIEALTGAPAFEATGGPEVAFARLSRDPEIPGTFGYGWKSLLTAMTLQLPENRLTALDVVNAARRLNSDANIPETETILLSADTGADTTKVAHAPPPPALSSDTAPTQAMHGAPERKTLPRRVIAVAVAVVLAVAIALGFTLWAVEASKPAEAPALPALPGKLGGDMQELLDSVTP